MHRIQKNMKIKFGKKWKSIIINNKKKQNINCQTNNKLRLKTREILYVI